MSNEAELVRAIVGGTCDEREADEILATAAALHVDLTDLLAHRLGARAVASRAAEWVGVASAPNVPADACFPRHIDRLDYIGEVRTFRSRGDGHETVYCAPPARGLAALRDHLDREPTARGNFCIVPPAAIRDAYARSARDGLLESARHRLMDLWPKASGAEVLGKGARTTFVTLLAVAMVLVLLAPFFMQPLVVPLVGVLLIVPAALKLVAAAFPQPAAAMPDLLRDEDLPVYTVLIPLRDEARMVPQLRQAMEALDYPALCSRRTTVAVSRDDWRSCDRGASQPMGRQRQPLLR